MEEKPSKLTQKQSFPFRHIERLISIAKKHGLQSLEVGGIKIVPQPKHIEQPEVPRSISERKYDGKSWDQLNRRSQEDVFLFGEPLKET